MTELENRIYSTRMKLRLRQKFISELVLVELSPSELVQPEPLNHIRHQIRSHGPKLVFESRSANWLDLIVDSDGVVRRATIAHKGRPSLAYSIFSQLHPALKSKINPYETHLINYWGPPGTIPRCRFRPYTCPSLKGKIVLLVEEGENESLYHTPVGEMTPSEILANDIETLAFDHPIYEMGLLGRIAIMLAMILAGAFYIIYYPVLISAIAITGTGMAIVICLFQLIFQIFDLYIPSANIILSLFITYLVFTGYRLALQENLQWRTLKQAQYLRELDKMKTNFLSLVSHDLKTPLAKIQAVVERLRRESNLPPEARSDWKELLDSIENSNNEMKRFITSILNLSKIESQKVILNKKSNDINLLIQQALKRLGPLAQQKNLTFEESLDPLFSIECDEDLMRQVLTNLIDNAIKYSHPHSKIIVRSREEEGFVRVEVEDFGPGIPKDQLPLMFRKFSRFLRPIKEQVKGTGLGLYLSKYFIELHGGSIRVKSIEGQGTTFSFTLPLHSTDSEVDPEVLPG